MTRRSSALPVVLLSGQAFALGLALGWVTVAANALFLDTYGSRLLPITYIGAAGAGAAATIALTRALRRRPLAGVAVRVLFALTVVLLGSWVAIWQAQAEWMAFALLVVLPIAIPVGFMFIVGQAGALLDVRGLKLLYPRVIAGFAAGFMVGGLSASPLLGLLGRTEHLLAAASLASTVLLGLVLVTVRTFPLELGAIEGADTTEAQPTFRSLLSNRFVVLIMGYQMLSAVESQWLDFLVYDRAGRRYADSAELARFVGRFAAITYGTDIVFLVLVAGVMLRRFGLRYGLTANPLVVLALVVSVLASTAAGGSGATIVFVLVIATRVSDMVLSDGATRTSVGAAYQAVPPGERLAAQNAVESFAVPVAIGISGVGLLVVQATVGTAGPTLAVLTVLVICTWVVCALAVYRGYGTSLLSNLRHRVLDPEELSLDGSESLPVLERLLASALPSDVRLALDLLERADHPALDHHLELLAVSRRPEIHHDVLRRLSLRRPHRAVELARHSVNDPHPSVRASSLDALAQLGDRDDAVAATTLLHDDEHAVVLAAAAVIARQGSERERDQLRERASQLSGSADGRSRVAAARLMGVGPAGGDEVEHQLLAALLRDEDPSVVDAALESVRWPRDAPVAALIVEMLDDRARSSAAVDALSRGGAPALAVIDAVLAVEHPRSVRSLELCVRVARRIGGPDAVSVLMRHVDHPSREVGLEILRALSIMGDVPLDAHGRSWLSAVIARDLSHANRVIGAMRAMPVEPPCGLLRSALGDELQLLRSRVVAALSLRYGAGPVGLVSFQLAQANTRIHSLAVEWLDVTLSGEDRSAIALLDPSLDHERRQQMLGRPGLLVSPAFVVREIAEDRDGVWRRPWLSACALVAASSTGIALGALDLSRWQEADDPDGFVAETLRGVAEREHRAA